ncbi:hypothetical protein NIES2135_56000 [Leptolyngbya boryana NIES-2135]|jgi:hypothetical protein|uniref:Uncharacterized protein n=1 Tax=Leptolyngbya boryana NIES-2135 TaxID=1973484 RepID=A0A1Z4JPS5_LEPBY|nr:MULTISPECIES: hypothetical protein [Leptolyngbya]ULP29780.1 hypothetical protein MCP04_27770 [Leptolyngbya boryana IU 594]BAY58726.1 hypothetical protein NIES2135_56000 [Leptolyngbya boryana NIES-2135]
MGKSPKVCTETETDYLYSEPFRSGCSTFIQDFQGIQRAEVSTTLKPNISQVEIAAGVFLRKCCCLYHCEAIALKIQKVNAGWNFMRSSPSRFPPRRNLWFERAMAGLTLVNLGLVAFDFAYIPWRDFWFRNFPAVTRLYDPIKGIEPHRDTETYLSTVDTLEQELQQFGLESVQVQTRLQDLRDRSSELVSTNPFAVANKSGTLERIKNRMREHVFGQRRGESAKQAFATFWSKENLAQRGVATEQKFFNQEIRPLIAVNYYRPIGENGEFVDWFWLVDAPFVGIFALEFIARTFYLSRRYQSLSWLDAMLWRWYDIFLLLPFLRWLRVIPTVVRLDQSGMVNLARVRTQASQGFVANISEDMAEVVVIQVIDRFQDAIARGEISRWLIQSVNRPYIDLNQRDEVQELATHLVKTTVYNVLPKIKPELEAVLRHNIDMILSQSPAYQGLKAMPLVGDLPRQINERLVAEVTSGVYDAIVLALEDKKGGELISQLVKSFGQNLATELQDQRSLQELQSLATDLLEEIKVNYVRRLSEEDVEGILEETRQIRQIR